MLRIGREVPFTSAIDRDKNQVSHLYNVFDSESERDTVVPLSKDEHSRYHSVWGKGMLEEKHSFYKQGRKNKNEVIMGEEIERKIVALEALRDTKDNLIYSAHWMRGAGALQDPLFKNYVQEREACTTRAQSILESLEKEYPQLFQVEGCMGSLKRFQDVIWGLKTQAVSPFPVDRNGVLVGKSDLNPTSG